MIKTFGSAVEELLRAEIGLDAQSIGEAAIMRAVRDRMKAVHQEDPESYAKLAATSDLERQKLIETLVVPETWFLRHRESFDLLVRRIKETWPPVPPGSKIRLLSIPCSTGEEPYSAAITLLAEGFDPTAFEIEGVDISHVSLEACRKASYSKNSFREGNREKLKPYFQHRDNRWILNEEVKSMVKFRWANVAAEDFVLPAGSYDFIFCRNLLIYLTPQAQRELVQLLRRALRDGGSLFCGPAETTIFAQNGFASVKVPLAFAFEKSNPAPAPARESWKRRETITLSQPYPAPLSSPKPRPSLSPAAKPPAPPAIPAEDSLQTLLSQAGESADRGELAAAAEICGRILEKNKPNAAAHHLLGLVYDAQDRIGEAIDAYKKALYLEPNHQEALLHLALLKHKSGDIKGAQILQQRAARLATPGPGNAKPAGGK